MNRTTIIGHVTKDAETRTVKVSGVDTLVTDFTVAANEGYGDNKTTNYFRITIWREQGAKMAPHLVKGRAIAASGVVSARAWVDNQGQARAQLELKVTGRNGVEFIGRKPGEPEDLPFIETEEEEVA